MVSSINPNTSGIATLGTDARYAKTQSPLQQQQREAVQGDRVELTQSSLNAARESVREGLMQVHQALALGHDAQAMLVKAQSLARTGGEGAQTELSTLLSGFAQRVDAAIANGARLVSGESVNVQAEPGGAPVSVAGFDMRLGAEGGVGVATDAQVADPALPQAAQRALESLQEAMSQLLDSARALEAHQGFLGAAQSTSAVRHDLDADGARLLALQVRQGLEAAPSVAIANAEPQAVLSLFRV